MTVSLLNGSVLLVRDLVSCKCCNQLSCADFGLSSTSNDSGCSEVNPIPSLTCYECYDPEFQNVGENGVPVFTG